MRAKRHEHRIAELKDHKLTGVAGGNPLLVGIALGVASNAIYDGLKGSGVLDPLPSPQEMIAWKKQHG